MTIGKMNSASAFSVIPGADLILYGMGERSIVELANAFAEGKTMDEIHEMPQVAFYCKEKDIPGGFKDDDIILHSHEECLHNKKGQAENVRHPGGRSQ